MKIEYIEEYNDKVVKRVLSILFVYVYLYTWTALILHHTVYNLYGSVFVRMGGHTHMILHAIVLQQV